MSELFNYLLDNEPQFRRARLAALYSDFRQQQTLNPDGYQANIEAWQKALAKAARAGVMPSQGSSPDLLILRADDELLRALDTNEWGRPLSLGAVVQEAMAKKELMPLGDFMNATDSIYNRSWTIKPWDIVGWGLKQIGISFGGDKLPGGKLVILGNVEEAAKLFAGKSGAKTGRVGRIYSKRMFKEEFGNVLGEHPLSDVDMDAFLKFLTRDKKVIACDGETIKLKAPTDSKTPTITQEDTSIASLKSLIADLEIQTKLFAERVDTMERTGKEAVAKKNRVSALAALRSKKSAETTLANRHATLSQLEEVLSKIEQAADQVDLVRVMESSTKVLSSLNKEIGGVERVDDVVDQLREQMGQVDEVGDVIAEPGQSNVDETEVDDELEAMEKEETRKIEEKERLVKEEKERKEAADTKRKLEELEEVERKAREAQKEEGVAESTQGLRRMSLEPEPIPEYA
ncbi:putative snf7 family protein [Botrytis cinerea BcDW1]|uniref:Putative snf7 family protein n=1 Tax=Botryotinia fuckeliana (strain BcDW1) TaxID=1290391 RepID=M7UJA0_BOTF1|nr:putative snf7 family protein [Botrytis cinerea BcDW1]